MDLTTDSPLSARLGAWAAERFPAANGALCLVMYAAALSCGRAGGAGPATFSARDVVGFFAAYAFLLLLRVYDEHKDFAIDMQNHPQRVLQRGLITLGHLKALGAGAIVLQLTVSLALDRGLGAVTWRWALAFAYSLLMAREFFIGPWLNRHLLLYAVSHMAVLPMAVLWMEQMGAGQAPLLPRCYLLCALALLSGFAFEIARKTRAPQEERETVDSYSKALGLRGAGMLLMLLNVAVSALLVPAVAAWPLGIVGAAAAALPCLLPLPVLWRFLRVPTAAGSKHIQAAQALQTLLVYALCTCAILWQRGVAWR